MHNTLSTRGLGNALQPPTGHEPCAAERLAAADAEVERLYWTAEAVLLFYWQERGRTTCPECSAFLEAGETCPCGEEATR